ncbi:MAG: helix-turn-helix domain-containing protein [Candidatus Anammoxibacter sp.]
MSNDKSFDHYCQHENTGFCSQKKFSEEKDDFGKDYVVAVLTKTKWNIAQAAEFAGLDINNFKGKMKKYKIDADNFKQL